MNAYDELSDEMIQALKTGVLETERAYNYKWDDICIGAKIAQDQMKAEIDTLRKALTDTREALGREYWDQYAGLDETRDILDAALK